MMCHSKLKIVVGYKADEYMRLAGDVVFTLNFIGRNFFPGISP